jgi:hypothetical protein
MGIVEQELPGLEDRRVVHMERIIRPITNDARLSPQVMTQSKTIHQVSSL